MKKKILIFLLIALFAVSFDAVNKLLSFKFSDGIVPVRTLYKQKKNIDVLVLGSSHAFTNVNTQVLFDEYGTASYILAGSYQPFWNSYFYLKEALKTQKPKLVVLEGLLSTESFNHSDHSRIIKNNFGLKSSLLKMKSLLVSSPKQRDDYFLGYRLYHSRYKELNASDRKTFYEKGIYRDNKGFFTSLTVEKTTRPLPSVTENAESLPMNKKEERYFKKIADLCKKEKIPLFVFVAPYAVDKYVNVQKHFNYLEKLSAELSVPFVNYNHQDKYDEIGLDFSKDFMDISHLNYWGSQKFSKVFGSCIRNRFSLPDRRGGKEYESWTTNGAIIKNMPVRRDLAVAENTDDFVKSVKEHKNLKLYINTVSATREIAGNGFFEKLGIAENALKDGRLYVFENGVLTDLSDDKINWKRAVELFDEKIVFQQKRGYHGNKQVSGNALFYKGKNHIDDIRGTYLLAYDSLAREIVAIRQIVCKNDGKGCNLTLIKK